MSKNHFFIVKEEIISVPKSLMTLQAGEVASIPCEEFACSSTVASAISRLNKKHGYIMFSLTSPDNGRTLVVKRFAKNKKGESNR